MRSYYKIIILISLSLLLYSCSKQKQAVDEQLITEYNNVWYRQASVDLGAHIIMLSSDSGVAVSRGRGDIDGKVYSYHSGKWTVIHSFPYSDYPQISFYKNKLWVINHLTHNGFFKPVLTEIGKTKKEIPLPKIMWDETDYVLWKSLCVLPEETAWMAGQQGNILFYNGQNWESKKSSIDKNTLTDLTSGDINDIFMIDSSSGWAVGKEGVILRYKNGVWKNYHSPTDKQLQSIVMLNESLGWAVGFNGTVLEFKNGVWSKCKINSSAMFYSVKAIDENHVWVCSTNSSLYFYNGSNWVDDKNAEYLGEAFLDLSIIKDTNGYLIWLIGTKGIYTNSQALGFSYTDYTTQSLIRPTGRSGLFVQNFGEDFPDLIVMNEEAPPFHYKNNNSGVFGDISIESGLINSIHSAGAAISADFNNDGYLDFLHFADDNNFKFFLGAGDNKFIDFTERSNFVLDSIDAFSLISISAFDFDNDGSLDLYFSNDGRHDMLFKNNGAGCFENVFHKTSLPYQNKKSFGACFSDFNNDGLIDILYPYQVPNNGKSLALYLNLGNFNFSLFDDPSFDSPTNKSLSTSVALAEDFNNDGWVDIFLHHQKEAPWLLINKNGKHFENVSAAAGFDKTIFHPEPENGTAAAADVNNDGWLDLFISSKLYLNSSGMKFKEVSEFTGLNFTGNPSFADIDNDGDEDLFIGSSTLSQGDKGAVLYRNNLNKNNYVKISVEGIYSNRYARGARVNLFTIKNKDTLLVSSKIIGAGSAPMLNNSVSSLIFAVDEKTQNNLQVVFPNNEVKILENVKSGQKYFVKETPALEAVVILAYKSLRRTYLLTDKTTGAVSLTIFLLLIFSLIFIGRKTGAGRFVNRWYYSVCLFFLFAAVFHYTVLSVGIIILFLPFIIVGAAGSIGIIAAKSYYKKLDAEIISHYKIEKLLGKGGMGKVYLTSDVNTKQKVALKVLMPELLQDEENKKRFSGEARMLSSFNHPNIVKVYELGESENTGYIAMEYLPGGTLKEYLDNNYPLSWEEMKNIFLQICSGLEEIHAKNIVHRDMKTGNIMLDEKNKIRIMDFGLSKSSLVSTMTSLGTVLGTLGYVAPEQVTNVMVDSRSDIFSLGVMLYELCTNKLPFNGENEMALIHSIFNTHPVPPSSINNTMPIDVDKVVMKCLSKNADERYQHVAELTEILSTLS
ncbi:MAG: protein kinase [Ignavibacteriaceae bacterium]|nr:protein kinase [Ignavibacteriaceae bacterium]